MPLEFGLIALITIFGSVIPSFAGIWLEILLSRIFSKTVTMALGLGIVLFLFLDLMGLTAHLGIQVKSPQLQLILWVVFAVTAIALVSGGNSTARSMIRIAFLWAVGISFHSAGEGMVVGADILSGKFNLAIIPAASFGLHKALEGLSVGSLLPDARPKLTTTILLATIAAAPTAFGVAAALNGLPLLISTILFAAGAGSCILAILRLIPTGTGIDYRTVTFAVLMGFLTMYIAGLLHEV